MKKTYLALVIPNLLAVMGIILYILARICWSDGFYYATIGLSIVATFITLIALLYGAFGDIFYSPRFLFLPAALFIAGTVIAKTCELEEQRWTTAMSAIAIPLAVFTLSFVGNCLRKVLVQTRTA